MRTTIDINDDLLLQIRKKAVEAGVPMKTMVNMALRRGICAADNSREIVDYRCRTFSLGYPPRHDIDHALDLSEKLEDEEISRKILMRK